MKSEKSVRWISEWKAKLCGLSSGITYEERPTLLVGRRSPRCFHHSAVFIISRFELSQLTHLTIFTSRSFFRGICLPEVTIVKIPFEEKTQTKAMFQVWDPPMGSIDLLVMKPMSFILL